MVGEAVADEAQTTLLDVLLDRVEGLLLGDLHLRVAPAGDFNDHVEDAIALVGEKRDVVEGGDNLAILLDEDAMFWGRLDTRLRGEQGIEYTPRVLGAPMRRGV